MADARAEHVTCECGAILVSLTLTPASLQIGSKMHKQSILLTPSCMSIEGRCSGCSKFHRLSFQVPQVEKKPAEVRHAVHRSGRRRKPVQIIGQLSLF